MSEGAVNPLRHGRSDQVFASPMGMDTMPMLLYSGTSPTPHHTGLDQYPYDNMRISPTLDNNYIPMPPHYEVLPNNSSRAMDFGVRTVFIYPFYPLLTHRCRHIHRWILTLRDHIGSVNPGFSTQVSKPLLRFLRCRGEHRPRQCRPAQPDGPCRNRSPCHIDHTLLHIPRRRDNTSMMPLFKRPSSSTSQGVPNVGSLSRMR